jgi:hypothetical protein
MQPAQFWSTPPPPGPQYPVNQQARSVHQTITEATIGCLHVIRCADFRSVTMSTLSVETLYNPDLSNMSYQHWQAIQNISVSVPILSVTNFTATTIDATTINVTNLNYPDLSNMSYQHWQAIQNVSIPHVALYRSLSANISIDNAPSAVVFDVVGISNDSFATFSGSRIYAARPTTFNIDYTFQFYNQGGGGSGDLVTIWIAKNGTSIPYSAAQIHVPTNGRDVSYSGGMYIPMLSGQYVELFWTTENASAVYVHTESASGVIPAIPSIKCEIHQL